MTTNPGSKLPHTLRLVVFFLRLALGLDFVNLGLTAIFDPGMRNASNGRSLGDLSAWLATVPKTGAWQTILAWAFLIVGICLILGFVTRLASIAGIVLAIPSLAPSMTLAGIAPARFIGDNIIVVLCLCIIMIARAGEYFGVDRFVHLRARGNDGR
jgi:uncharacterized membrane protein YphA (DoxX/SURF4 family)